MLAFDAVGIYAVGMAGASASPAQSGGPIVTAVTLSPQSATVTGGGTQQFTASVLGLNSPPQSVTWSSSGGSINASGLFTAPATTAPHQYITVTATSVTDPSKSRSVNIVVPGSNPPAQTGIFQMRRRCSRRVLRLS